ncbi:MAG: response regulator transcription factor [Opitutaceae bacterium]|nr:response regulator transcription factor [Opitutaceae bacterium]
MKHILLVDDHAIFRQGLRHLLAHHFPDAQFGEASNLGEALELLNRQQWDLLICDLTMPGRNGYEVLAESVRAYPQLPVLILSAIAEETAGLRAIKGGSAGYLSKQAKPEQLIEAVQNVLQGRRVISPALVSRLTAEFQRAGGRPQHELLSDRELQVFHLSATGKSPKEIAADLSLSPKTISTFRRRIFLKLGVRSDVELARYAGEHGISEHE